MHGKLGGETLETSRVLDLPTRTGRAIKTRCTLPFFGLSFVYPFAEAVAALLPLTATPCPLCQAFQFHAPMRRPLESITWQLQRFGRRLVKL